MQKGVLMEIEDIPEWNLGPCCVCGCADAHAIVFLDFFGPPGFIGWGCFQCGLPSQGAIAILCEPCVESGAEPLFIADGHYATDRVRLSLEHYRRVPFVHNDALHPELTECAEAFSHETH
jgi:hypothetical protein